MIINPTELPSQATKKHLAAAIEKKVSGEATGFLATGRGETLKDQFRLVKPEFAGVPLLCWLCARTIIVVRRDLNMETHWPTLQYLFETPTYRDLLLRHLNTRWLVAVCDTYADHGNREQRIAALSLSMLINLTKLAETERLLLHDTEYDKNAEDQFQQGFPHSLWDGVTSYLIDTGDMPRNMFARLRSSLAEITPLDAIGDCLINRLQNAPSTMLSRLSVHNPRFWE